MSRCPPSRAAANHRLNPGAAARLTGYLVAHGQYTNQLSRSTFDSHLVTARAERASWRQPQDTGQCPVGRALRRPGADQPRVCLSFSPWSRLLAARRR